MEPASLPSPGRRLAITVVVMAATLITVLDSTIANVALPHMQATLNATQESVAWVLTSYIIATAIAMPVTGWLEDRFGRRRLFIIAVAGFTVSSAACGLAPSLTAMVAARALQGVFGAFIGPLTQAVMLDIYPRDKQPLAMTIWGMGVMIAPIMGPVLGGWLTDAFDWRWVFFINVPIGFVVAIGLWMMLDVRPTVRRRFDIIGFALLALMLGSLQLMLDRGTQLDWFYSTEIIAEAAIAISALWMFVVHSMTAKEPLISLALFRNRNLMIATIYLTVCSGIMMAGAALITPMLQRLMGYSTTDAGLLIAPRGVAIMASMMIAGRLATIIDSRIMIAFGLALIAWSQMMMTGFDLDMGSELLIISGMIQGFGFGFIVLPLNLLAFATLEPHLRTEGASLYNLSRNLGGSIAIAVTTALIARNVQISHADLSAHVTTVTLPFLDAGMIEQIGVRGEDVMRLIDAEVNRQALMIAYLDDFWIMGCAAAVVIPLALLMRRANMADKQIMLTE